MRLDEVMRVLQAIPLFREVEPEALRVLAFSAVRRPLRAGDVLFRKGEAADCGFVVIDGEIALDTSDDGSPSPHIYGRGTLIGQAALFAPIERPATAVARDAGAVLIFSRELVARALDAYPGMAMALRKALAAEVAMFRQRLSRLTL